MTIEERLKLSIENFVEKMKAAPFVISPHYIILTVSGHEQKIPMDQLNNDIFVTELAQRLKAAGVDEDALIHITIDTTSSQSDMHLSSQAPALIDVRRAYSATPPHNVQFFKQAKQLTKPPLVRRGNFYGELPDVLKIPQTPSAPIPIANTRSSTTTNDTFHVGSPQSEPTGIQKPRWKPTEFSLGARQSY